MENSCNLTAVWLGTAALQSRSNPGVGKRVRLAAPPNLLMESGASCTPSGTSGGFLMENS